MLIIIIIIIIIITILRSITIIYSTSDKWPTWRAQWCIFTVVGVNTLARTGSGVTETVRHCAIVICAAAVTYIAKWNLQNIIHTIY